MVKVLVKKLNPNVQFPAYKTSGASGMDLMAFIDQPIKIAPKSSSLVPTGLSLAFPEDYEVQIRPRSGLAAKNNITVLILPELLIVIIEVKLKLYFLIMAMKNSQLIIKIELLKWF